MWKTDQNLWKIHHICGKRRSSFSWNPNPMLSGRWDLWDEDGNLSSILSNLQFLNLGQVGCVRPATIFWLRPRGFNRVVTHRLINGYKLDTHFKNYCYDFALDLTVGANGHSPLRIFNGNWYN